MISNYRPSTIPESLGSTSTCTHLSIPPSHYQLLIVINSDTSMSSLQSLALKHILISTLANLGQIPLPTSSSASIRFQLRNCCSRSNAGISNSAVDSFPARYVGSISLRMEALPYAADRRDAILLTSTTRTVNFNTNAPQTLGFERDEIFWEISGG